MSPALTELMIYKASGTYNVIDLFEGSQGGIGRYLGDIEDREYDGQQLLNVGDVKTAY